jgi:hypothetical protein
MGSFYEDVWNSGRLNVTEKHATSIFMEYDKSSRFLFNFTA